MFPLTGAIIGAAIGGPIGVVAGLKIGGVIAALGGTGGRCLVVSLLVLM